MRMSQVRYDVVQLQGGWDQITPSLSLKPGVVRDSVNFECAPTGGYRRVAGYERYSGLAKPSDATWSAVQVVSFTNTPALGDTLTGGTSAATGYVIAVSGSYIVLTQVSGSFTTSEALLVGATPIGTATPFTETITAKQSAQYQALAANVYRALISAVPGSGPVRGVVGLVVAGADELYAFRDNAGGTAVDVYKASGSGWTAVPLRREVYFTAGGGAVVPLAGETITQGANSATVYRVMETSGGTTWAGTTVGKFIVGTPTPGEFVAGAATLSGGATCTLSGASTAITLTPGGKFEFSPGNMTGSASTLRLYGCDNVNRGFEFDGTTLAPIDTGVATDTPKHVVVHKNHVMWSFDGSVVYAGPGVPFRYATADGGGEIATGDTITGFLVQPGAQTTAALAVYCRGSTGILYGTGNADWNYTVLNTGTGAIDYTAQNMSQSYVLDDPGVLSMAAVIAYGNFQQATLTNNIKTFIASQRDKVSCSTLSRDLSQYRIFFTDGLGLYLTIVNGKLLGSMQVSFPNTMYCAWEGMSVTGVGLNYFGDTDGYVHQADVGSSFDGAVIDAYLTLNWNPMGSPRVLKRFRHASMEMQGQFYAEVSFGYSLGYGTTELGQPTPALYESGFQPAPNWDEFTWDDFTWDGRTLFPTEVDLQGTAENIQVSVSSTGDYIYPYTINSIINHYTPRRGLR